MGYEIKEFPRVLARPPVEPTDFTYGDIRNRIIAEGNDDNGTVRYATRRQFVANLTFMQKSNHIDIDSSIDQKFIEISNRQASGNVLEGVDRAEMYIRDAYILRDMRKDYNLFNSQLGILGTEQDMFLRYIRKEATLGVLAEERGISYETVQQKMVKIKNRLKQQVVGFMEGNLGGIA